MINKIGQHFRAVMKDEKGLESLEYTVFALAFLVIIGGIELMLSSTLATAYSDIGNWLTAQAAAI